MMLFWEEAEEQAHDTKMRHSAVRKLHRASWAEQDGDGDDARKDLRAAAGLILKMATPNTAALVEIAKALDSLNHGDRLGLGLGVALGHLVLPGEVIANVPNPCA